MGIFDFFGNRKEKLSENVAALEQKLQSLKQEFLSEEKRGKELKLQNDELAHQIVIKQNEVSKLQQQRNSLSEETDSHTNAYAGHRRFCYDLFSHNA